MENRLGVHPTPLKKYPSAKEFLENIMPILGAKDPSQISSIRQAMAKADGSNLEYLKRSLKLISGAVNTWVRNYSCGLNLD